MHIQRLFPILATLFLLTLGLAWSGCSPEGSPAPKHAPLNIPSQTAFTQVPWHLDLSPFGPEDLGSPHSWSVVSGQGKVQGTEYVNTFNSMGSYPIQVRAHFEGGGQADAAFLVFAQAGELAVVQRGNDLDLLDGSTGALVPLASGGASPLSYKTQLPNGWFIYERMGGSSVDLFAHNMSDAFEIGPSAGLDTVYATHSLGSVVLYEQGSASETGLYAWHPKGPWWETVGWRAGMHNRNPMISDSNVVYFEYGNNGQPDLCFWNYGDQDPTTAFSSDYPEVIQAMLPDGGVVFSTNDPVTMEADLYHYRMHNGSYTVGGDLSESVQALDMTYQDQLSGGLVIFSTSDSHGDDNLWLWSPYGLNSAAIATSSSMEVLQGISPDDRVLYSIGMAPDNDDLSLYHHTTQTTDVVASSPDNEMFEAFLPNSDVIFTVEADTGRQLKHFNVTTGLVDVIASAPGQDFWLADVLSTGMVVYSKTGSSPGLYVWDSNSRTTTLVAAGDFAFEGEAGGGDFVASLDSGSQTDLALWDAASGELVMITETDEDEQFQCAFHGGAVIYSRVTSPSPTADLYTWHKDNGFEVRITTGTVDYSVVTVVNGAP